MKRLSGVICGALILSGTTVFGSDSADPFRETLSRVPAAELPDNAAKITKQSKPRELEATTIKVTKAAVGINPASAPAIVGAISKAVPEMAPVSAGVAAAQQPKQASAITRAAVAAAPSKVGKIVAAVCRAVPNDYRNVAVTAADVAPAAGKEILDAVASALPTLKPYIQRELLSYAGNPPSVATVVDQAKPIATDPAAASQPIATRAGESRGPAVGPPYIPLSGTPGNVTPGTSGEVPTGGRGYAAP